jgi:hypothetical protein
VDKSNKNLGAEYKGLIISAVLMIVVLVNDQNANIGIIHIFFDCLKEQLALALTIVLRYAAHWEHCRLVLF